MAVLGLRFCVRAFSSCGKRGPLFIAVCGPLTIAASLVAEHRLQTRRLSNCGSRAQLLRGMWDLPGPGLEPVSPALAGGLSTTAPPGKPLILFFNFFWLCHEAWGMLVSDQGSNPGPQQWKHWVLTTGPPGSSQRPPILACALYVFRPNVTLFFNLVLCLPHLKGKILHVLIYRCVPLHWFIQSANIYWAFTMCQAFSRHCRHSNEEIRTDKNLHPQDRRRGLRDTNYYV